MLGSRKSQGTIGGEEMIEEVTYYDIICDRCGKSLINESETCYPDKDSGSKLAARTIVPTVTSWMRKRTNMYRRKEITMSKTTYCGECEKFLYEDTDGFGICGKTNEECYCGDKCHITHGKP